MLDKLNKWDYIYWGIIIIAAVGLVYYLMKGL